MEIEILEFFVRVNFNPFFTYYDVRDSNMTTVISKHFGTSIFIENFA